MNEEIKNEDVEQTEPINGDNGWAKELEIRKEAAKIGKSMMNVLVGIIFVSVIVNLVSKTVAVTPIISWIIVIVSIVAEAVAIVKLSRAKMPYASIVARLVLTVISQMLVIGVSLNASTISRSSIESILAMITVIGFVALALNVWFLIDYFKFDKRFTEINPEENPNYIE